MKKRKHHSVYFKLFSKVNHKIEIIERKQILDRYDRYDYYILAKKWQSMSMRREILRAYLSNENPNWHQARYLTNKEAQRRNDSYGAIK